MSKKLAGGLIITVTCIVVLNRIGRGRGATTEEICRPLAGDELVPGAMIETTHGITIEAPPNLIWPWLVQVGYHRGGWYADSAMHRFLFKYLFEPMAPQDKKPVYRPSADRILSEYQDLTVGDSIPDGPPDTAHFLVKKLDPDRHLVLYTDQYHQAILPPSLSSSWFKPRSEFSWVFTLEEIQTGTTRLLLRARINIWPRALYPVIWIPLMLGESIYPHLMLQGIKQRVEGTITELPVGS